MEATRSTMSRAGIWPVLRQGLAAAWPIGLGYLPIGLALGVLGRNAGLDPLHIGLMSSLVFAGSAQFIAVAMLGVGAAPAVIVGTVFMVNLRHLLMSAALALHLRGAGQGFLALFAYGVTDESFAVNHTRFRAGGWDRQRALVVNQAANAVWIIATVAGGYLGGFLAAGAFGLDFALIAMFLCLLVFQLRSRLHQVTGVAAGVIAVAWSLLVPGHSYIMVAACGAATAGFFLGRRRRRGRS